MNKNVVVIVLGNRLNDDGTITKIQEERLEYALELNDLFHPNYFILSGGMPNKEAGISEAEGMFQYLIKKGIEKERLIKEEQSNSTVENAKFSIPLLKELKTDLVIITSSDYHFANPLYKLMESFINELKESNIPLMIYTKAK